MLMATTHTTSLAGSEVTIEGVSDNEEWIISEGRLDTSTRRPYFLSP